MGTEERETWEAKSSVDKARYESEMATYKVATKLSSSKKPRKDPNAPRRPMSAFLAFSNKRRAALKRQTPDATNSDLSKMLSKMWKEATPEFKLDYVNEEAILRAKYKVDIVAFRKKRSEEVRANLPKTTTQKTGLVQGQGGMVMANGVANPSAFLAQQPVPGYVLADQTGLSNSAQMQPQLIAPSAVYNPGFAQETNGTGGTGSIDHQNMMGGYLPGMGSGGYSAHTFAPEQMLAAQQQYLQQQQQQQHFGTSHTCHGRTTSNSLTLLTISYCLSFSFPLLPFIACW
jgi:hypothetical protein